MLKSEQIAEEIRLPGRTKEGRPIEILLAAMCIFSRQGKEEVSLSELQECVSEFQKEFSLGYNFSEHFPCSVDLLVDLRDLSRERYVRQYIYRHDAFLPKRFVSLMPLGKGRGGKIVGTLSSDTAQALENAVTTAIRNYKETWRSWAR
ncbi:hypothetical protein ES706_06036 [subsurface metagenome]